MDAPAVGGRGDGAGQGSRLPGGRVEQSQARRLAKGDELLRVAGDAVVVRTGDDVQHIAPGGVGVAGAPPGAVGVADG